MSIAPGWELIVYAVYGDESRDEEHGRVYAVASVFGHDDDWAELEGPWKAVLGDRVFHAAECEFGKGDFRDLKQGEGKRIYRELVTLIAQRKFFGLGVAISVLDYSKSFPNDFVDAPYLWAFGDCIHAASELAYLTIPSGPLEITFDRNEPIEHNTGTMYAFLRRSRNTKHRELLPDKISFACRRTLGIQVADLFARETMKRMDTDITKADLPIRRSFVALQKTGRFNYRSLVAANFEENKRELAARFSPRADMSSYRKWLENNRLQDCLSNRIAHLENFPELWESVP